MKNLLLLISIGLMASTASADPNTSVDTETQKLGMQAEAQQVAKELVGTLGKALKQALIESGPGGAIGVCRDTAPMLAGSLSRRTGWKVGRVSLKVRNPLIGEPDRWEQATLKRFELEVASGTDPDTLQTSAIVQEHQRNYFRYMKALPVKPLCLTCHGNPGDIPDQVSSKLALEYPNDRATGYVLGEIRGAVTIKRRLNPLR